MADDQPKKKKKVNKKRNTIRGEPSRRINVDTPLESHGKLTELARRLNTSKAGLLQRMIDVLLLPDRTLGQRLCVCNGDRKIADIAGV
jgi:hypothetical protein